MIEPRPALPAAHGRLRRQGLPAVAVISGQSDTSARIASGIDITHEQRGRIGQQLASVTFRMSGKVARDIDHRPNGRERVRWPRADPAEIGRPERQSHRDGDRPAEFGREPFIQAIQRNIDVGAGGDCGDGTQPRAASIILATNTAG